VPSRGHKPSRITDDWMLDDDTESSRSRTAISSVSDTLTSSVRGPPINNITSILPFELNSANPKSERGEKIVLTSESEHASATASKTGRSCCGASRVRTMASVMREPETWSLIASMDVWSSDAPPMFADSQFDR
jgi:hypothetical protein